ncbi:MAG TPA: hypothetical protein VET88_05060, partial [Gammaproteobacteria bacterium]|nr:hypothetical protein [Gammaproteobacteria bacterium]
MRRLATGLLILLVGWGLGWVTSRDRGSGSRPPVQTLADSVSRPAAQTDGTEASTPEGAGQADDMVALLQRNDYAAVLERYESLETGADESAIAHARAQILAHARRLVVERRFSQAEPLLQRFLAASYRDVEARVLLAQVYQGQQDLPAALDQLYEAKAYAWTPTMLQQIDTRIRFVAGELKRLLQRNEDHPGLLALYRHLVELEPDYAPWFMELAAAQLALDDKASAYRTLQLVVQDPDVGARAQSMLTELTVAHAGMQAAGATDTIPEISGIPLMRSGNHFMVQAWPDGGGGLQLLIDTGASLTILTPAAFAQRGIHYRDTGRTGVFNT